MPTITLADGSQKEFNEAVTVLAVAESIGPGLAKATLAGSVNESLVDASFLIEDDAELKIITDKDPAGLDILRHSTAHLLAHAVKELYPHAQVTIGPVIEDGFYYDFSIDPPFKPEDLPVIEKRMQEIAKKNYDVTRKVLSREEAIKIFSDMGEHYKVEIIRDIPGDEQLTAYQQGDFIDLCRGPHVPRTGLLKAFKLTKMSGAYWRGDSNNEMLQRVYGTAWADKKQLKEYLTRLEEAEKRDHRKLGQKMDLFHLQQEAPGMVFWHPNGWTLLLTVRQYMRDKLRHWDYQEISTPQLVDSSLWEKSGHADKFGEEMFTSEFEHHTYAFKPMSCPCHIQVFNQGIKSYRDLPIRLAEFGNCHRNEPSGALHGLMRLRNFIQDDAHIFCTEDQIQSEVLAFIKQLHEVYAEFGFTEVMHKLSTRPENRVGSDVIWDKAEYALEEALNKAGVDWEILPGEGAFYGPKIEFSLKDCIGRVWQCGTMQVDFSMPERLEASYIDENSAKQTPVMLHRAIFGSFERFLGILIEQYAGWLPAWLAPTQVAVLGLTDRSSEYVQKITKNMQNVGIKAILDLRNEKIGFKIREHTIARVPYQLVIGDREVADETVAVRSRGSDKSTVLTFAEFLQKLQKQIDSKAADFELV